MSRRILTAEEMDRYKRELATYEMLRKEIDFKQAGELINGYLNEWGTAKLAEKWGIKSHSIYELRTTIRKEAGDILQPIPRAKRTKNEPKTGKAKIQKKEPAAEKKSVALTIFEDRIQELEKQVAEQQARLEEKDRALEELETHAVAPIAEDLKAMLELVHEQSEQVAAAVQATQERQQPSNLAGIALTFEGEFSADTLKKRLGKVITMIEGEPSTFDITFHIIEKPRIDVTPKEGEPTAEPVEIAIPEDVQKAVEQTEALQKQLDDLTMNFLTWEEEMKTIKEQTAVATKWGNGYTALKTDKKGLHHPKSEFEKPEADESSIPDRSVITRHGIKCFQSFYVCPKCGDRGKTYTPKGSEYVNCKKCSEGMAKRDATEKGFPNVDTYGNVYIAGEYVQEKL